ncbi:PXA domain-containing protein [Mycena sanguinolenta]|uniref:PXA domain-containing protein n=1 Tax=Mycena sanguinolenta TaxID=230812 RepID=A0A8H6XFM7_9AGAR|nr:PXA domain-containing protein [Mycena sanguinolenta]
MPPSFTSAKSTLAKASLSKRLLFPTWPSNDLPSLFATPATPPELTAEVYDFIALALRAFVNPWWTKITRYDKEFLPDITRILTHVFRAVEARALEADLAPLVFPRRPGNCHPALSRLPQCCVQIVYVPHMAVAPDGTIDPEYLRQVVDHILKACLPEEDYAPEPQRFIIREIVLKILHKDVIPKITQPWFIQKTILDSPWRAGRLPHKGMFPNLVVSIYSRKSIPSRNPYPHLPRRSPFHTLIVVALSAIQALSGMFLALIHAYQQAVTTIKRVNQTPPRPPPLALAGIHTYPDVPVPRVTVYLALLIHLLVGRQRLPFRRSHPRRPPTSRPHQATSPSRRSRSSPEIFTTSSRMASASIMHTLSLLLVLFAPFLDRLLPYLLAQTLSPKLLLTIVRNAKRTLFPNGYPAPPPVDPTPEEQAQMRARLLAYRGKSPWVETHVLPLVLGSDPTETLAAALDPLTSRECNVHLVVLLLDCIIGTLFPDLLAE